MRLILLSLLLLFSVVNANNAQAKVSLHSDCKQYKNIADYSFVLFSKRDLIELGACTGVALLKENRLPNLVDSCKEVLEAKSVFGIATLTKLEAIQAGQCAGVINYIYNHYHNERTNYGSKRVYSCIRGDEAVELLSKESKKTYRRNDVRDLLCGNSNG